MHDGAFDHSVCREPTVSEIGDRGLMIRAVCQCGHSRDLIPDRICISRHTEISDVGGMLKCSRCGTRGLSTRVAQRG